jgi:hypothetical protein
MIWGEPDRGVTFQPLKGSAYRHPLVGSQLHMIHLYADMVDGAYGVLKRASRRNVVIGGCTYTSGVISTLQWIKNLRLADGKPPRMDMYAHNPFSYAAPGFSPTHSPYGEVQFKDLRELAGWVDRYLRPGMPLFLSEWTIPTRPDEQFPWWVQPQTAAAWVTAALRECRAWHRIYALGWVNLYDQPPVTFGGLLTAPGTLKPDFYAFARG